MEYNEETTENHQEDLGDQTEETTGHGEFVPSDEEESGPSKLEQEIFGEEEDDTPAPPRGIGSDEEEDHNRDYEDQEEEEEEQRSDADEDQKPSKKSSRPIKTKEQKREEKRLRKENGGKLPEWYKEKMRREKREAAGEFGGEEKKSKKRKTSSSASRGEGSKRRKSSPAREDDGEDNPYTENPDYVEENEEDEPAGGASRRRSSSGGGGRSQGGSYTEHFKDVQNSLKRPRAQSLAYYADREETLQKARDLIERMNEAYEEDIESMQEKQPALEKLKMLKEVVEEGRKAWMQGRLLENGFLKALAHWIEFRADQSLPNLTIRTEVLKLLSELPLENEDRLGDSTACEGISKELLRTSQVAKCVRFLMLHPEEIQENKKVASKLVERWSRLVFNLRADYKKLEEIEKEAPENVLLGGSARKSHSQGPSAVFSGKDQDDAERKAHRAKIPQKAVFDYVVRPPPKKPTGPPPSESPNPALQKKFADLSKKSGKTQRAMSVSINRPGQGSY